MNPYLLTILNSQDKIHIKSFSVWGNHYAQALEHAAEKGYFKPFFSEDLRTLAVGITCPNNIQIIQEVRQAT